MRIGVSKKISVWEKCGDLNAQKDEGSRALAIPKQWHWRDDPGWGLDGGCVEACNISEDAEDLCTGCASAVALKRILEMAELCTKVVRGVALPLSVQEDEALGRLQCTAIIICAGKYNFSCSFSCCNTSCRFLTQGLDWRGCLYFLCHFMTQQKDYITLPGCIFVHKMIQRQKEYYLSLTSFPSNNKMS